MYTLAYRESGFDCDYVVEGETMEEFLRNGADHAPWCLAKDLIDRLTKDRL